MLTEHLADRYVPPMRGPDVDTALGDLPSSDTTDSMDGPSNKPARDPPDPVTGQPSNVYFWSPAAVRVSIRVWDLKSSKSRQMTLIQDL